MPSVPDGPKRHCGSRPSQGALVAAPPRLTSNLGHPRVVTGVSRSFSGYRPLRLPASPGCSATWACAARRKSRENRGLAKRSRRPQEALRESSKSRGSCGCATQIDKQSGPPKSQTRFGVWNGHVVVTPMDEQLGPTQGKCRPLPPLCSSATSVVPMPSSSLLRGSSAFSRVCPACGSLFERRQRAMLERLPDGSIIPFMRISRWGRWEADGATGSTDPHAST
ncbi:hypothetical protein Pan216_38440 [Planctomycetes bacterium Pan216]|uniref:Uncharacterized protein n=1 Tax=Kolteria novifilia TaxID=2527975 RepID=A0A518B7L4_9BACT|nr:hypothetical protein Pan216_38440 [Planctomycetes bacterium Pan216]